MYHLSTVVSALNTNTCGRSQRCPANTNEKLDPTLTQKPDIDKPVLHTGRVFNVVCINANGLRTQLKRDLLGKLLYDLRAGVGLITETHLRKSELKWIRYPTYNVVADYCSRVPTGQQIAGGVIILAHRDFTAKRMGAGGSHDTRNGQ